MRVPVIIGLGCLLAIGISAGCKSRTAKPSVLITDTELMSKFSAEALPKDCYVMVRLANWNLDGTKERFERTYECTVLEINNAPIDPQMVSDRFEAWLAKLVKVTSTVADTNSPPAVDRVIKYAAEQTVGELHYTIKPIPGATMTENGKETPGNFREFDIQIIEQRKSR